MHSPGSSPRVPIAPRHILSGGEAMKDRPRFSLAGKVALLVGVHVAVTAGARGKAPPDPQNFRRPRLVTRVDLPANQTVRCGISCHGSKGGGS